MVLYTSTLWYVFNSKTGELPIHSSIKYGANGRYDDDFAKVATDALTKGLSKLGFNADVFMGLFDDNKYVNQVTEQFADESWKKKLNQVVDKLPDSDKKKFSGAISKKTITSKNYKAYITRAEELLVQFEETCLKLKRIMSNVGEILEVFDNDNAYFDEYHDEPIDDGTYNATVVICLKD